MELSTDQAMGSLWYILALILVGSALIGRRMRLGSLLGMLLAWVVIFCVVLTLFSYRRELGMVKDRVQSEVTGTPNQQTEGQALRIAISSDGHYWVDGALNGTPTRFLIDSGASVTALSEGAAKAAGLNVDATGIPMVMQTANGQVEAHRASVATLSLGPIRASDLPVVVSPAFGEINVIGMNMLSRLKSWGVQNGEMVLTP
ncbi:retropepsin-like aspartic protease family protein [Sphingobium aromaticiconvertens]|uniref:retropepsin-like aspartic protease family protein n=1 Tax=Sphingobium aromaticiconvertens TaxID=365341 RepID=UPI00301594BF